MSTGLWTGSDSNFHWTTNWRGVNANNYLMFVVNYVAADGIQYFDGTNWFTLTPPVTNNAGDTITTALICTVFKSRLLLFNVQEVVSTVPQTYANRVRFSEAGNPLDVNAWNYQTGSAGFRDAPTNESIISVQSLKDRLIVFFENSTYELVFTNNDLDPFIFQKINTELGVESTHSTIPFDKIVMGMGSTGVHACNALNVERIDEDIPDNIFGISNINDGPLRIQGVRDYYEELVYWTYPADEEDYRSNNVYPNRLLVMDYVTHSWAQFDDSITALGYFYLQSNFLIWENIDEQWQNMNFQWHPGQTYELFRSIICGNQQGWTFILTPDLSRNCMSLQITNMVYNAVNQTVTMTIINHNISPQANYVFLNNIQSTDVGGVGFPSLNGTIQQAAYVDGNTLVINGIVFDVTSTTYKGSGTIERVSQVEIYTKQYNFFHEVGRRAYLAYADYYVDKTPAGQITVDYLSSASQTPMTQEAFATGTLLGTGVLETSPYVLVPFEASQEQFWHRIYFQTDGEVMQFHFYWTDSQIKNLQSIGNGFVINAAQYWAMPTAPYVY